MHARFGEVVGMWVALGCGCGDRGTAGVGESEDLGDFVKGFTNSVVLGLPQQSVITVTAEQHQLTVVTRDNQRQQRKSGLRRREGEVAGAAGQKVGVDV